MKHTIKVLILLSLPWLMALASETSQADIYQKRVELEKKHYISDEMVSLKVMLTKLRELIFSLKEIDDLEKIGLSHDDVAVMRETLMAKINQTKLHALVLIRRL